MSKILHKCLSLAVVIMLLASLTLSGTLSASADNKTGDGLASYAMTAYNEGWQYVWGGASYGYVDCSGLIYSYVGGGARVTEDMLYSSPESGYVSNGVPDIPGIGLWQPGHVGVYVGGGMAVDARDEISNVCYSAVSSKSWVMWFKVAGVSYGNDSSVTNDNHSTEDTSSSDKQTDSSNTNSQKASTSLSRGSQGTEVNALQERLKELGYFTDNTTEYFGYVTESALIEFQSIAGLTADGVYNEATKKALLSDDAPVKYSYSFADSDSEDDEEEEAYIEDSDTDEEFIDETDSDVLSANLNDNPEEVSDDNSDIGEDSEYEDEDSDDYSDKFAQFEEYKPEEDNTEVVYPDALYQEGDEDSEIANIQYMLVKLGYFDYDITGNYGYTTAYAVARYQLDKDLDATGYINEETLDSIYQSYYGEDEELSDDEEEDSEEGTLSLGMSGKKVEDLQRSLVVWGYLTYGEISEFGYFDEATEDAVIDAQKSLDLEENGVVTEEFNYALSGAGEVEVQLESTVSEADTTTTEVADNADTGEEIALAESKVESETVTSSVESTTSTDTESESIQTATASVSSNTTSTVSTNSTSSTAVTGTSSTISTVTDTPVVDVPKTGIESYFSKSLAFMLIGISVIVIFFAINVHYWNSSMEKRRQRARKTTTVSVYTRRYM